jgi:hypothetical protein
MRANLSRTVLLTAAVALVGLGAASPSKAATIVQNTAGTGHLSTFLGQSFTTPNGGPWNNIAFSFFSDQGLTPVAAGKAYILATAYSGVPANLPASSFLTVSTGISGGQYTFSPSFVLQPNTQYFLYEDTVIGVAIDPAASGIFFTSGGSFQPFTASTNFQVSGNVITLDTCLRDNTTGNILQWNSKTGAYMFTRCSDGFTVTGTGKVSLVNGIKTLTDFKSDRRISAGLNTGQLTGNATIYLMVAQGVWQSFQVMDTNPNAVCKC